MKQNLKIAVIGGTGKSGKYLVDQLIDQGYNFKILVRNPKYFTIKSPLVDVIPGDVSHYESVKSLVSDCSSIVSTLGMGIPYSAPNIFSMATSHILKAMGEYNINRYIVTAGLNVDTNWDLKSPWVKTATDWMYSNYPKSTEDRQKEYELLAQSNVDWTMVRLPLIELTEERKSVQESLYDCPGDKISATDLAHFLIGQLAERNYLRKAPFLANLQ